MTKIILAISCSLMIHSTPSWGASHLIALGAGGDPKTKSTTIFDDSIQNLGKYVQDSPQLNVDIALDGGHETTEAIINHSFPNAASKSNFLEADYKRLIEEYKIKLENNKIASGDQLMILINSHGAEKSAGSKTHKIATSAGHATNLNNLSGASLVDLDQLEDLKKLAKKKGVQVAIIDFSCHSGNTLSLADENTCVISASGPNHYGSTVFPQNFTAAMKQGKNLEKVFLEALSFEKMPTFPMISTSNGLAITSMLYEKITPFFYYTHDVTDKLTPFIQKNISEYNQCMADKDYDFLIRTIDSIENLDSNAKPILKNIASNDSKFSQLKKLLGHYKKSIDSARLGMKKLGTERLSTVEKFSLQTTPGNKSTNWSHEYNWSQLLNSDFEDLKIKEQVKISGEQDPGKRAEMISLLSLYTQAQARKEEILNKAPDLSTLAGQIKKITNSVDLSITRTVEISTEFNKLYSELYKSTQINQPSGAPNPCRDFKL